jgi:alpha-L-fucosidase
MVPEPPPYEPTFESIRRHPLPDWYPNAKLGLGAWLHVNGEAIRGTRPWRRADSTTACGVPVRFTRKDRALYALLLGTPREHEVCIRDVRATAGWRQRGEDLNVQLLEPLRDQPAHALRMTSLGRGES